MLIFDRISILKSFVKFGGGFHRKPPNLPNLIPAKINTLKVAYFIKKIENRDSSNLFLPVHTDN